MRKAIFRDMDACVNCKACLIACNVKHMSHRQATLPLALEPKGRNLINVYQCGPEIRGDQVYQSFVSIACMHCEEAPCIRVCPASAIYKDTQTSITLVDRKRCIGCKVCLWVCPYGAPSFDNDGKLVLCDLCIDRLKEGKKTACEATCPANAIFVGTPEEIAELQAKKAVRRIERGLVT
ncbi:4Fe-4S dicluster domain-containing protein [Chloroflexota bacterium]